MTHSDSTELIPDEVRTAADQVVKQLMKVGYRHITVHRDIRVGSRVRHTCHLWDEASERGTATVLAVLADGNLDVEIVVMKDTEIFGSRVSTWASYHTRIAYVDCAVCDG